MAEDEEEHPSGLSALAGEMLGELNRLKGIMTGGDEEDAGGGDEPSFSDLIDQASTQSQKVKLIELIIKIAGFLLGLLSFYLVCLGYDIWETPIGQVTVATWFFVLLFTGILAAGLIILMSIVLTKLVDR